MGGWNNFNLNNNNNKGGSTALILVLVVVCFCCLLSSIGGYWVYTKGWFDSLFDKETPEPTYGPEYTEDTEDTEDAEEDPEEDAEGGGGGGGGECLSSKKKYEWRDGVCYRCSNQQWVEDKWDSEKKCKEKQREYEKKR